ncbi:hypothetical protein CGMCC3_g11587 [Colletotrichum fructicola]|nr:uncharacterized protein CGMCC3_g11587 [Colletotrichum fructicola]KAE9572233.1 hypothetical protein CGMCC3_g11587 [Colletotrichum fructicola]
MQHSGQSIKEELILEFLAGDLAMLNRQPPTMACETVCFS